jgi:lipopolysaccharide export system protein LptA
LNSKTTIAKKNARLTNENGHIEADQISYNNESGIINATGGVKLTLKDGTNIQADQLVYNINTHEGAVSGKVKLTAQDVVEITAQQLDYNGNSSLVKASGGVEITTDNGVYQTETIEYNLNEATGFSGPVSMTINAKGRGFSVTGKSMGFSEGIARIAKAKITRCQLSHPEYQYVAKEADYDGRYLRLKSIFLYLKGIPIFYLPVLKLDIANLNFPDIEPGYNHDDGFFVKYDYSAHLTENIRWKFTGIYRSDDYSSLLFGITASKEKISNYTGLYYNTDSQGYGIEDRLTYNTQLFVTTIDGSKDFSDNNATQLGFSFTRKYWDSPLGKWQLGILVRDVSKEDGSGGEYGGTYGGYRLDYNPFSNLTLSLLQLYSLDGGNDYRDFMDEFKLGSNLMYSWTIPLKNPYSLGLNGTYNNEQSLWIHQIYQLNYQTDCLNLSVGWDNALRSWTYTASINL